MTGPHISLDEIQQSSKEDEITPSERAVHYFMSSGVSYHEFCETPLPVLFSVLRVEKDIQERQEENMDKGSL